jgi:hypothetical protein
LRAISARRPAEVRDTSPKVRTARPVLSSVCVPSPEDGDELPPGVNELAVYVAQK